MNVEKLGIGIVLCAIASAGCPLVPNPNPLMEEGETGDGEGDDPCSSLPLGAVGAAYSYTPDFPVDGGPYSDWSAMGLPEGLAIDPDDGQISGIPMTASTYADVSISATSTQTMETVTHECGPLTVNPALSALRVSELPGHCMPVDSTYAELLAQLDGGDGTDVHCIAPIPDGGSTCPLGNGNGSIPPGLTFDADTCTYSGSISSVRRGAWVWMMAIQQSGHTTWVPFCATNDVDTFHDIVLYVDGSVSSDLEPAFYEYDLNESLHFGGGSHQWAINDPSCPSPDCDFHGLRFAVTCAPFDVYRPWSITLSPSAMTETGLTHEMTASGPTPDPSFHDRAFVASFTISYCTSSSATHCDTLDGDAFESNAQTKYHYDILAYPQP